jgi:hypothetical protein
MNRSKERLPPIVEEEDARPPPLIISDYFDSIWSSFNSTTEEAETQTETKIDADAYPGIVSPIIPPQQPVEKNPLRAVVLDNDDSATRNNIVSNYNNGVALPLKAVVLDNDETTGSYGLVFSVLTHIRRASITDENAVRTIYKRLAAVLVKRKLFRPYLGPLLHALTFMRDEGLLDSVIMYTNQTEEVPFNPYNAFWKIMYNVPYSISYLMYEAYKTNAFDDILSRPPYLHGIYHAACPKSFSRIFNLDTDRPRDTTHIIFVDDNACPQFITAPPKTVVDPASYYRISAYVRVLTDEELDEALKEIFEGFGPQRGSCPSPSKMGEGFLFAQADEEALYEAIKKQYRKYSPLENIALHRDNDDALAELRRKIMEKYT